MSDKEAGHVKWFDNAKGFGFISREDGQDVFVHYRSIHGDGYRKLKEGQLVQYTLQESERGLQAIDVIVDTETTDDSLS